MQRIQIAVEGPDASQALAELLAIPGLEGTADRGDGRRTRDATAIIAAVGSIVGVAGSVAGLVDHIIAWREKWKARGIRSDRSVLEDARDRRVLLMEATREQLEAALRTLQPSE